MPVHRTFLAPQVEIRWDRDTDERFIEIDWRDSLIQSIPAYTNEPELSELSGDWLNRVLSVEGTFYPTSEPGIIKMVAGEIPPEPPEDTIDGSD